MSSDHGRSGSTRAWVLAIVLLTPAVVLPLLPGIYAREDPTLWSFPFYFWFQFALIVMATVLTSIAFVVVTRAERRERAARDLAGPGGED